MKVFFSPLLLFLALSLSGQPLQTSKWRCNSKKNPVLDDPTPQFSWKLVVGQKDKNVLQTAYHLQVATSADNLSKGRKLFWDSGKINSEQSVHVPYSGPELLSRQKLYWRVKIWDNQQRESPWSEIQHWEMGLLDTLDWVAQWINPSWEEAERELNPPALFRKSFSLNKKIKKARLYITAHGIFEVYLNGQKVSEELFAPGWTSYRHRLQYQTYDVTSMLTSGENAAGVSLGDGWYRGNFGFGHNWNPYGTKTALLCQLEVEYQNGRRQTIISDGSWRATTGPIRMSSFYHGETYDARLELPGWHSARFEENNWQDVAVTDHPFDQLICPETAPVKRIEEIKPDTIFQTPKGETVIDFGQNMVGWVKFSVNGTRGDSVLLRHAEVLDQEGNFYLDNIRSAQQKITYILKGGKEEIFEPHFSFQGFRYVRVDHFPGEIKADNFTAVVIHTDLDKTGSFECSSELVNQLQHNILWGQKSNYLDIPTDCPQRDERMGWTGDVQVFAATGSFNYDSYTFLSKWLKDLQADQLENGSVPYVIPDIHYKNGSTGWGDASTIVPWILYLKYGDRGVLERQYHSMKAWVGYLEDLAGDNYLVQDGAHFGDWMYFVHPLHNEPKPGHTDVDLIATAYFAWSASLTAKTAAVLGRSEDQQRYEVLFSKIKEAFQYEFVTPSSRLSPNSQTAYVLALSFGLLEEDQISKAFAYLVDNIEKRNHHLSTGFLGTPLLCHVLSKNGRTDLAYKLLLQESFPSWLYQVKRGATTMWERWDGIEPDGSFQETYANSFNHFAKGAVGDWMYSVVGGIRHDEDRPGYKHIIIKPEPDPSLSYAKTSLASPYGLIQTDWSLKNGQLYLKVDIPPNTTATIFLPGQPEGTEQRSLGSGEHEFEYTFSVEKK